MKPTWWHISLTIMGVACGVLISWLYLTQSTLRAEESTAPNARLIALINHLEEQTQVMENRLVSLRKELEGKQQRQTGGEYRVTALEAELRMLEAQAGLREVAGPGVVITLDDNNSGALSAQQANPGFYQPDNFLIHDKNILYLVNELKRAGAEAIAVNNQRIVPSSTIRCVGTVILVNSARLAPVYEIKAVGDPEALEKAIANGEEFPYLKAKEFPVKITRVNDMLIPAYKGGFDTDHLQPAA